VRRTSKRGRRSAPRLVLLLCAALLGCGTTTYGVPPDVSRLAALRRGESTKADLLLALGEPDGRGAARLAPALPREDVWVYQSVRTHGVLSVHMESEMLLVLVRDGRYEGHLWLPSTIDASLR